ncbi:unnamed protein product [Rangifer tarandus platyrhynchus]|uniref:Uncharacterized protein n=2 Tax=Rangifer tarandus platyrhynchus TaxID=3082113 RepID=A0AC59ZF71_RANTA|nr:unnamed protein product [Rangifer tarandus platyrhynchus]
MLTCSYTALNAKASACVSVAHTVTGAARSLPESALSAHRQTEVSGNLCSPKGGLWPVTHECVGIDGLGPQPRTGRPQGVTCHLSRAPHMGSAEAPAEHMGDGSFKDEHRSASQRVFFCSVILSKAQ